MLSYWTRSGMTAREGGNANGLLGATLVQRAGRADYAGVACDEALVMCLIQRCCRFNFISSPVATKLERPTILVTVWL